VANVRIRDVVVFAVGTHTCGIASGPEWKRARAQLASARDWISRPRIKRSRKFRRKSIRCAPRSSANRSEQRLTNAGNQFEKDRLTLGVLPASTSIRNSRSGDPLAYRL